MKIARPMGALSQNYHIYWSNFTVWWNFLNIYTIQELLEEGESAALKELEGFRKEMSEKLEKFRYTAEQWNEG